MQMNGLNVHSDLQLGRYGFNPETDFFLEGFETLVSSSQALSKLSSKMKFSIMPFPLLPCPFILLFSFLSIKIYIKLLFGEKYPQKGFSNIKVTFSKF